ncbi:MAG TPA: ATP-binding protein [Hanamia sp.]|nr:ATP-binding protein [Hanamia sp.]
MAAADQIKSLIKSFAENDESRFYATAMQIAASEARSGHKAVAEELKRIIDKAKSEKSLNLGVVKALPQNSAQKELKDLLELSHPKEKLKDMVLKPVLEKSLKRVLDEQRKSELLRQNNLFPRKKLLFVGPSGTGKTMSASVLASELGLPLFVIRLDGLISRYMGESISKLRLIFDAMYQMKAVYLFDEFDSIGSNRTSANDLGEIKRVLNTFLMQIEKDNSNSLIIAATNLPDQLDKALFRRFDDIINYPYPNKKEILKLLKRELLELKKSVALDLNQIAEGSLGLSFAEIHRVCEDITKDFLVYGVNEVSEEKILSYAKLRKQPY